MKPIEFCYWLQGNFEITGVRSMTKAEAQVIQDHLQLVFKKVTPKRKKGKDPKEIEYCSAVPQRNPRAYSDSALDEEEPIC